MVTKLNESKKAIISQLYRRVCHKRRKRFTRGVEILEKEG
jgi:hypothetical protein